MIPLDSAATQAFSYLTEAFTWISNNTILSVIIYGALGVALAGGVLSLFVRR